MKKHTIISVLSLAAIAAYGVACNGEGDVGYAPTCGDGIVEGGEQCDDGNNNNGDTCLVNCRLASCGDGVVRAGFEVCDDGNVRDGDACASDCSTGAGCGNGLIDVGETCDDGNTSDSDECLRTCKPNVCGDGFAQLGVEQCDDGNEANDDGCSNDCKLSGAEPGGCPGLELPLSAGKATTLVGDTSNATDSGKASCGGAGSKDIVYSVVPKTDGWLVASLTGINGGDPVLHVRENDCTGGVELACADKSGPNGQESVSLEVAAGKTYFVYVDGQNGVDTQFALNLQLSDEVPGDSCPGTVLSLEDGDQFTVLGSTETATSDYKGAKACDGAKQTKELVYSLVAKSDGLLEISVDPEFDAVLYARVGSCTNGMQVACSDASWHAGGPETISINAVQGTTYSVFVDGYQGSVGNFALNVKLTN
jgi:cysteine-rich repeat protein